VVARATAEGSQGELLVVAPGEHHDGQGKRPGAQRRERVEAPAVGEAEIDQDGVCRCSTEVVEGRVEAIHGGDLERGIALAQLALQRSRGGWHAGSGAIWSLRSNKVRPAGWTSADAAGLPIFPGLGRWDEVKRGTIDHALRFTVERTRRAYVYPARHYASDSNDPSLPPMGLRVRLKADYPIDGFPRQARIVLAALKRYGMIVADNGSNWYISGAPDPHWNNDDLHALSRVKGSAFEVVDTSSLSP
jgi:hypothetical protein